MVLAKAAGDFWLKCSINNTFLYKNLPISAKNTTFAAKFNKNLSIMSYISVAQYASI